MQRASKDANYRSLDDIALRQLAESDPNGFLRHSEKLMIIDEIQRVPQLLSAIKLAVDKNTRPGQFLLTGSANIQSLPGVTESLAGRIRKLRLRPLAQGEIIRSKPTFLEKVFDEAFRVPKSELDRQRVIELSLRGGFPEVIDLSIRNRKSWHRDYVDALLERDLADIAKIQRHDAMRELVSILAAWSGKVMDISSIGSALSIRRTTLESYINALEALFLVERIRPWTKTDYERVGKHSKVYFADSGLMSSILGWQPEQVSLDPDRSGKLIETFVFNELCAQIDAADGMYSLFHYRDREQREIDFLIEREDRALVGIEVKAGSAINPDHFKHLRWFKDNIAGKRKFVGVVLYTGQAAGSMGERLWAVPMSSLWT